MSDLRTAAQRMLAAVEDSGHKADVTAAADDLRAALAQQDESEMYAAAYSSACGELRKVEAQRDALLELVAEMNQHEGVEWSEDLRIKINSALMQALEALAWKAGSEPALYGAQTLQAITALRAALAQQAEPVQKPVAWMCSSPELMAKGYKQFSSRCEGDWNIPVYLSPPRCPNCSSLEAQNTELDRKLAELEQAETAQEPVAWMTPGQDLHLNNGEGFRFSDWTPLYPAPPQRKPLAEWQINDLMAGIDPEDVCSWSFRQGVYAAEKHHGVKP